MHCLMINRISYAHKQVGWNILRAPTFQHVDQKRKIRSGASARFWFSLPDTVATLCVYLDSDRALGYNFGCGHTLYFLWQIDRVEILKL